MLFHVHDGQCGSVVVLVRRNTIEGSRETEKAAEKLVLNGAISFRRGKGVEVIRRGGVNGRTSRIGKNKRKLVRGARGESRSSGERWQFFKIKAVKPNLQVCRRTREEVV